MIPAGHVRLMRRERARDWEDTWMSTFALIPGAGGAAWYWHRVVPLLREAGHEAIAVDLPADDETTGLPEYASMVISAIGGRTDTVLVAMSLGGFTAPLVAEKVPLRALVLVNAMIPVPGETAGAWGDNTGAARAREAAAAAGGYPQEFDLDVYFMHDVPPDVIAAGESNQRPEADVVFGSRCDFIAWPRVPIRAVAGADDRLFPADFQRAVARERLGIEADVLPGGHLMALSRPAPLAQYLLAVG
jgi:alpha/beta hydrolase family protein